MSVAGHTPGPWLLDGLTVYKLTPNDERNLFSLRLSSDFSGIPSEELHANARLISAAPDMKTALEMILEVHDGKAPSVFGEHAIDKVRSALAKARGEGGDT